MKKVFIVEDCQDLRELFAFALSKEAYQVEVFPDAETITQHLTAGHFADLLVCDIGLPGMPGNQLIQIFRSLNREPHARVLVASGMDGLSAIALAVKADSFLSKPISLPVLKKAIIDELFITSKLKGS